MLCACCRWDGRSVGGRQQKERGWRVQTLADGGDDKAPITAMGARARREQFKTCGRRVLSAVAGLSKGVQVKGTARRVKKEVLTERQL